MTLRTSAASPAGSASGDRRGVARGAGRDPGGPAYGQQGGGPVVDGRAHADQHQQRARQPAAGGDPRHLAGLAGEAERAQQRPQGATERLGDVLAPVGECHALGGLEGADDDGVGARLGRARAPEMVGGHRRRIVTSGRHTVRLAASGFSRCRFAHMADQTSPPADLRTSPLHDRHVALGAKLAEFGGWSMPLEYPSGVVKEHTAVREAAGIFDVSHLGKVMVAGPGAAAYVNATLSNDLGKIAPGKAQYTLCCDAATGGVVDDLIAYYHDDEHVLLVPNAANSAEVCRRLLASRTRGREGARPPHAVRRAGGAGPEVRRGPRRDRLPVRPRLHVVRRGGVRGHRRGGVPHRLHRRARVRADRAQRRGRGPVGPPARGR